MCLLTLDAIDGRTSAAKRARELMATIEADLGGADRLSEGSRQLVQRAAVLGTYIENCEAMWLAGETVGLASYTPAPSLPNFPDVVVVRLSMGQCDPSSGQRRQRKKGGRGRHHDTARRPRWIASNQEARMAICAQIPSMLGVFAVSQH